MPSELTDGTGRSSQRVALVSGTSTFGKGFERLWRVPDELRLMRAVLVEAADLTIHPRSKLNPTLEELEASLTEALQGTDGRPPDVLVLYYSGHGVFRDQDELRIAAHDSTSDAQDSMLSAEGLVDLVLREQRYSPREIVLLLDCCYAGRAVNAFKRRLALKESNGDWVPMLTVIGATDRNAEAQQLRFVDSFAASLRNPPTTEHQDFIPTKDLFEDFKDRMRRRSTEVTPVNRDPDSGKSRAFRNPRYESPNIRMPQEAARAGSGWAFCGRAKAIREIVSYLVSNDDAGLGGLALTGAAGTGKSVLLDWIHTGARGRQLPGGPGNAPCPPFACVDGLVDVRGLTIESVTKQLAAHLDTGTGSDPASLIDRLATRDGVTALLVDSVEACLDADELFSRLLEPLSMLPGVRLVMAWNRAPDTFAGRRMEIDSDDYTNLGDVIQFVRHVLRHRRASRWQYVDNGRIEQVADAAAKAAGGSWLRAYLFAVNLSSSDPAVAKVEAESSTADLFFQKLESFDEGLRWAIDLLMPVALAQGSGLPVDDQLWAEVVRVAARPSVCLADVTRIQELAGEFLTSPESDVQYSGWRFEWTPTARFLAESTDQRAWHAAFVKVMVERLPAQPLGTRDWTVADRYTRAHFAQHAQLAGVLREYLDDPEFLLAMDRESLRRALTLSTNDPDDKALKVRALSARLRADTTGKPDGHALSRMALLAQQYGLPEIARRASESTEWWQPRMVLRTDRVGAERPPTSSWRVFCDPEGTLLVADDHDIFHTDAGQESQDTVWRRVKADLGKARPTAISIAAVNGRPCAFVGQSDGRAWIRELYGDPCSEVPGLELGCELVTCQQAGDGFLIAGHKGWQWRQYGTTGPLVPPAGPLRLGGAAVTIHKGRALVVARTAKHVSIWLSGGKPLTTFRPPHSGGLTAIAAASEGVYTGASDGTVLLNSWDGKSHAVVGRLGSRIVDLRARSIKGDATVVAAGWTGEILVVPRASTAKSPPLDLGVRITSADIESDGRLLVGTEAGVVRISQ